MQMKFEAICRCPDCAVNFSVSKEMQDQCVTLSNILCLRCGSTTIEVVRVDFVCEDGDMGETVRGDHSEFLGFVTLDGDTNLVQGEIDYGTDN